MVRSPFERRQRRMRKRRGREGGGKGKSDATVKKWNGVDEEKKRKSFSNIPQSCIVRDATIPYICIHKHGVQKL